MTITGWRRTGRCSVGWPLVGICPLFFSWLDWASEKRRLFHHTGARACAVNVTYRCGADRDHLAEGVSWQLSSLKGLPSTFCAAPLEGKPPPMAHTSGRTLMLPFFQGSASVPVTWESSAWEICLFLLIYLFNHLFMLVWTCGYLFCTSGYNPALLGLPWWSSG